MSANFSIFGANGFLAGHIIPKLEAGGHEVRRITRGNWPAPGTALGHVIFTIGMTASFRTRPFETIETQVVSLHRALKDYSFKSFLYLSSTRVYRGAPDTREDTTLRVNSNDPDDIYNLAKLTGESLCLTLPNPEIRVVRMSNVFGKTDTSDLFLTAVQREAIQTGKVTIRTAPESAKDYIDADFAAERLIAIALSGSARLYNVAAGHNITNAEIAAGLRALGVEVSFAPASPVVSFPQIDIRRLTRDFNAPIRDFGEALAESYTGMAARLRKTGSLP